MTDKCPHCGQWMPAALELRVKAVIDCWNQVATRFHLPLVRRPASLRAKIKTVLREESDMDILRAAFVRFASNDFIREHRYGLASWIPNRHKWLEAGAEDAYREKNRGVARTTPQGPIPLSEMARMAGMDLAQYKDFHGIGEGDE